MAKPSEVRPKRFARSQLVESSSFTADTTDALDGVGAP